MGSLFSGMMTFSSSDMVLDQYNHFQFVSLISLNSRHLVAQL